MASKSLDVFVFSYNRGDWLQNLLWSIECHIKSLPDVCVHIFDDHSTDAQTLKVLADAKRNGIQIHYASDFDLSGQGSRGGLHSGIEAALVYVARERALALLLQDDMQIVRPVTVDDLRVIEEWVDKTKNPFVYVNFWTGGGEYRKRTMLWNEDGYFLKHSPRERRFRAYTDVCIVDVDTLRQSKFTFGRAEKTMDVSASKVFGPMAWSPYPFTAMLPDPSVYREGECFGGNIFRFQAMDLEDVDRFMSRDVKENLPIAEKFLKLEGGVLPAPWRYGVEVALWKRLLLKLKKRFA